MQLMQSTRYNPARKLEPAQSFPPTRPLTALISTFVSVWNNSHFWLQAGLLFRAYSYEHCFKNFFMCLFLRNVLISKLSAYLCLFLTNFFYFFLKFRVLLYVRRDRLLSL